MPLTKHIDCSENKSRRVNMLKEIKPKANSNNNGAFVNALTTWWIDSSKE